jgi:hypothetical protein
MDTVQRAARAITDSMNGRAWRNRTPLDIAQALADAGLLADTRCRKCNGTGGTDLGGACCAVCDGSGHRRAET